MTRKEYDLNVNYQDGEDAPIDQIAAEHGFERTASGGGPCGRDLHYSRAEEPTPVENASMTAAFKALTFLVEASIEVWTYDEDDAVLCETESYDLLEAA